MEKNIYKYDIEITEVEIPSKPAQIIINEELKNILDFIMLLPSENRIKDLKKREKVIYLESYQHKTDDKGNNIYCLKMVSLKYNQAREVLNKDTLRSKGWLKSRDDGDKEYNHIVIVEKNNVIKAAFENNYYGLQSLGTVITYINDMTDEYFKSKRIDTYYFLTAHNEVSKDFLQELQRMRIINSATIVIERERLGSTDFSKLANREELRDEVELTFKRTRKKYIPQDIIKEYYSKKDDNGIKRIYLNGRSNTNKVKLDTQEMKENVKINVKENILGEVDSEDMFTQLYNYIMEDR